jgi:uncharacterized protein (DUF433 family)
MAKARSTNRTTRSRRKVTKAQTSQKSFRIADRVLDRLKERAELKDVSANALAQRFIDEGLRMDAHPQVFFRDGAAGRRPAIVGTRLDVWQAIETFRMNNKSIEETADYLEIPLGKMRAAVAYYADYKDETDDFATRMKDLAGREEETFRRQQEVLA